MILPGRLTGSTGGGRKVGHAFPLMKISKPRLLVGSAFILAGVYFAFRTQHHDASDHDHAPAHAHAHAHGEAGVLTLNEGRRWETDAPLRLGMQRIQDAAQPVLAA